MKTTILIICSRVNCIYNKMHPVEGDNVCIYVDPTFRVDDELTPFSSENRKCLTFKESRDE